MPRIHVEFDCPTCGTHCSEELAAPDPDFSADRGSDRGVTETEYLCCENGHDIEIEIFNDGGITATLVGSGDPVSVEEIYEPEPDEPPHDVFQEFDLSQWELLNLLKSMTDPFDGRPAPPTDALLRMVFSQLVAVLEAYLADRLHREALDSPRVKRRLVGASVFKDQKIPLSAAIADPGLAERTFVTTIKSVLYHDFKKVENLYKIAFQNSKVFPSDDNRRVLEAAVKLRHHCVHRNGKDKDGNLQAISTEDVESVAKAMRLLVAHIEQAIEDCHAKDAETEVPPTPGQSPDAAGRE